MDWHLALLLGAIVSSTDAAVVFRFAVLRSLPLLMPFGGVIVAAAASTWTWRFDPAVAAGSAVVSFAGTVMFLSGIIEP